MNLYLRYFDEEVVVKTAEEGYQFLCQATGEQLDTRHLQGLVEYMESPQNFTKRFKIKPRVYYVGIKTDTDKLEDFKARGEKLAVERAEKKEKNEKFEASKRIMAMSDSKPGWYEGRVRFKRVVFNKNINRNEYIDTDFAAFVKAHSVADLYERLCEHLRSRPDVDPRSQLPSIKGKNFIYRYIGTTLPQEIQTATDAVIAQNEWADPEAGVPHAVSIQSILKIQKNNTK